MVPRVAPDVRRSFLPCWQGMAVAAVLLFALTGGLLPTAWPEDKEEKKPAPKVHAWRNAGKAGLLVRGLSGLRIHQKNPSRMWAHVHGLGAATSTDGGATWAPRMKGIPERNLPRLRSQVRISLDPRDSKVLYLVIDGQIYRSQDVGASWSSITSGALASLSWDKLKSKHLCWEVQVDPKKSLHLRVGTRNDGNHNGGLYVSTKGGRSWEEIASSARPDTGLGNDTWLVRGHPSTDKVVTVGGRKTVWFSEDRGRTFVENSPGGSATHDIRWISESVPGLKELYLADARGIWRARNYGERWDKKPLRAGDALYVAVDPTNKKRVFAVFHDRGVEESVDAKHSKWSGIGGAYGSAGTQPPDPKAGYCTAQIREVVPVSKKTIYLASPVTGLHVSSNGGKTFAQVQAPEGAKPEAVMPEVMPRMALVGVHPAKAGAHLAVSEHGCVHRSADRGETWERVGRLAMAPVLLQPCAAEHTWLAAGRRLRRSADDGATWETLWEPKDPEERIVALHQGTTAAAGEGTLRILLERTGVVMTLAAGEEEKWKASKAPGFKSTELTWGAALAVDPGNGDHLVIAARTIREAWSPRDANGGVYETWDGGKKWTDITGALRPTDKNRKERVRWNRGRLLLIDLNARLLLYGADGLGLFARPWVDPKGKQPKDKPDWVPVTPAKPARPSIDAYVHTLTVDQTDSRLLVQLRGPNDETGLYDIAGRTLRALYDYGVAAKKPDTKPEWKAIASPGANLRLSSLVADRQLPGRFLASDWEGEAGVLVYEIPGSLPAAEKAEDDGAPDEPPAPKRPVVPEGMRGFTGSADKTVRVWKVDRGEFTHTLEGHEAEVLCVALSPDERFLLSGSSDQTLRIWNPASAKLVANIPVDSSVNAIAIDDDSEFAYLALEETQQVLQVDLQSRKMKGFRGHSGGVTAVAAGEDVNRIYSGSRDATVRVWDTKQGTEVLEISIGSKVNALVVSADGSRIYALGGDNSVQSFDASGKALAALPPGEGAISDLALSPDGTTLFAAGAAGVRALSAQDMMAGVKYAAGDKEIVCITLSVDGKWLIAGDRDGGLWLWTVGTAEPIWSRGKSHETAVLDMVLTPDETSDPEDDAGGGAAENPKEGAEEPAEGGEKPAPDEPAPDKPAPDKPAPDKPAPK